MTDAVDHHVIVRTLREAIFEAIARAEQGQRILSWVLAHPGISRLAIAEYIMDLNREQTGVAERLVADLKKWEDKQQQEATKRAEQISTSNTKPTSSAS